MSTQYDAIGANYNTLNSMPLQKIQHIAMKRLLGPLDSSKRVLELACGTGFYTRKLLSWGASHVTAVDISPVMISTAQKALPEDMKDQVSFCVADCTQVDMWNNSELKDQKGGFDFVIAAWLLNYAASEEEMRRMFENVYSALKPGGKIITLTINAGIIDMFQPNDPASENEKHLGYIYKILERLDDGYSMRCHAFAEPPIEFDFYFLREDVYSKAAFEARMSQLAWSVVLPDEEDLQKLVS